MTVTEPFTDEFRNAVRRLVRDQSPIGVARVAYDGADKVGLDSNLWRHLVDLGAVGMPIPEELGGSGGGSAEVGVVVAELGRTLARVPFAISTGVAAGVLLGLPQRSVIVDELLTQLAAGSAIVTVATWEQSSPTGQWHPATTGLQVRNGRVSGRKEAVPFVMDATSALAFARDESGALALVLIDLSGAGVRVVSTRALDRTVPLGAVELDAADVTVLAHGRAAELAAEQLLDRGAAHRAQESLAAARVCLQEAVDFAGQRVQFDRPIAEQQAIKHLCAEMLVKIELAQGAVDEATRLLGRPDRPAGVSAGCSLAKALACDAFLFVADAALHIHGGMGFTWEHDSHLYLRRARSAALDFGDAAFHQDRFLATSPLTEYTPKGTR